MAQQRRRSVPASPLPRGSQAGASSDTAALHPPPQPGPSSRLVAQADALAKMTVELNLRAVGAQAERLERELKQLVVCTGQDKEFLKEHQRRIMDIWREIVAVKTRVDQVKDAHDAIRVDFETCLRETADFKLQVSQTMGELKSLVDGVASQLDRLPTAAELDAELMGRASPRLSVQQCRRRTHIQARPLPSSTPSGQPGQPSRYSGLSPKRRIQQAIGSTRRWHRDHKTTALTDAQFIASYLRQQSKRDPPMAVFIQKAIQRRVQPRRSSSHPRSLDDFCQGVAWRDVTETIEEALVKGEEAAVRALRHMQGVSMADGPLSSGPG